MAGVYGYFPSRRALLPLGQYQIILLGDTGTTCLICYLTVTGMGVKSQVQHPNCYATKPPSWRHLMLSINSLSTDQHRLSIFAVEPFFSTECRYITNSVWV